MYETMVYWETADAIPEQPRFIRDWARQLAAQAIRLRLVDGFQMIFCPVMVGGGKRFFPEGVRLDLALIEERRFSNSVIILRYAIRRN